MLAGAGTAGVAWATLGGRVTAVETAHAETRQRVEKVEPQVQSQGTDIAVIKEQTRAIKEGMDRLEDHWGTKPR
jgi:hypothetical protein